MAHPTPATSSPYPSPRASPRSKAAESPTTCRTARTSAGGVTRGLARGRRGVRHPGPSRGDRRPRAFRNPHRGAGAAVRSASPSRCSRRSSRPRGRPLHLDRLSARWGAGARRRRSACDSQPRAPATCRPLSTSSGCCTNSWACSRATVTRPTPSSSTRGMTGRLGGAAKIITEDDPGGLRHPRRRCQHRRHPHHPAGQLRPARLRASRRKSRWNRSSSGSKARSTSSSSRSWPPATPRPRSRRRSPQAPSTSRSARASTPTPKSRRNATPPARSVIWRSANCRSADPRCNDHARLLDTRAGQHDASAQAITSMLRDINYFADHSEQVMSAQIATALPAARRTGVDAVPAPALMLVGDGAARNSARPSPSIFSARRARRR